MQAQTSIPVFRIVPAPLTGIGWVALQRWDQGHGEYRHLATFRTTEEANKFISSGGN